MADDTKPNAAGLALLNAQMDSLAREVGALNPDDPKREPPLRYPTDRNQQKNSLGCSPRSITGNNEQPKRFRQHSCSPSEGI